METKDKLAYCLLVSACQSERRLDRRWLRAQVMDRPYDDSLLAPFCPLGRTERIRRAARARQAGIQAVCIGDQDYPVRLAQANSCPLVLYYRGQDAVTRWNHPFAVTVIGSRSPSAYGQAVTRRIVAELAARDTLVISGLARGIDGLAHQVALDNGGLTIAVVAQGPDLVYPPEHAGLTARIARQGVVLSEHPPGTQPRRPHFPARNRLLSGLADVVAVMEARPKSGTLITAGFAADQGREVLAVPGSILGGDSGGCHLLLREGAGLIESAADILALRRQT